MIYLIHNKFCVFNQISLTGGGGGSLGNLGWVTALCSYVRLVTLISLFSPLVSKQVLANLMLEDNSLMD